MNKLIFTFFLLLFHFSFFGQNQKIRFSLFSKEGDCSTIPKDISLVQFINGKDSLLEKYAPKVCDIELEFPRLTGSFLVVIKSEGYENVKIPFQLSQDSAFQVNLGAFELKKKTQLLQEVTISGIKRDFIQIDADKTTVTVKDNDVLTVSSLYDAIIKIPGVVPYPGGGLTVGGKFATIYFEGIPSNLSGDDLINLLKSLPATSIEKIEIISNPGASYDANLSGAIINVISLSKTGKWISGTISLNYGLNANNKLLPSVIVSGKRKKYNWQLQGGNSYFERTYIGTNSKSFTSFDPQVKFNADRKEQNTNQFYYFKPSINYRLSSKSSLALNYNLSFNQNQNKGLSTSTSEQINPPINLQNDYKTVSQGLNHELVLKSRNTLDTLKRIWEITAYYADYKREQETQTHQSLDNTNAYNLLDYNIHVKRLYFKTDFEIPFAKQKFYMQTGVKYSKLFASSLGKYDLENSSEHVFENPSYDSSLDFDYDEDNLAGYLEMKKGFGEKLSLGAGVRVENFTLNRRSTLTSSKKNNYLNLFPSFNGIYRFSPDINFITTYSRKISVPSYSQFDPNNSGYYDSYNSSVGNILLSPNFYDNLEVKFTIFDYLQLSMDYSHSQNLNLFEISAQPNSLQTQQTFKTYHNVNVLTYFFSVPVPFGIFKQGLKFFDNVIDVDKINFVYLYTERTKTSVSGATYLSPNKAIWNHGVYSQFILPFEIRMNVDYYFGTKGTFQIFNYTKPRSALEIVLSKSFLDKKLKTSLTFEDIFNTSQSTLRSSFVNVNLDNYNKDDTRIIWFKLAYSFGRYEKHEEDGPNINPGGTKQNTDGGL